MDNEKRSASQPLDANQILIAEYTYIAQAAFQTNEDRARYVSFYVLSVGSLIAAIFSSQLDAGTNVAINWGFAILFTTVGAVGMLTILQLVQLRLAWFDSVSAMNRLKQFYHDHNSNDLELMDAFSWTEKSLPKPFKWRSISAITAAQVAILAGINLGSAVMWVGFAYQSWWWVGSFLTGILYMLGLLLFYRKLLEGPDGWWRSKVSSTESDPTESDPA